MAVWDAVGESGMKGAWSWGREGGRKRGRPGGGEWLRQIEAKEGGDVCGVWRRCVGCGVDALIAYRILPKPLIGFKEWTSLCG